MSTRQEQSTMQEHATITLTINGKAVTESVPVRMTLAYFLRDQLALTGTHIACDQGACGACTVLMDGLSVRACLVFAVQAAGHAITTVEGLAQHGKLSALQQAFVKHQALQCGFCTPGFLMLATELVNEARTGPPPDRAEIQHRLSANLCRCTGYEPIINAVEEVVGGIGVGGDHDRTT